MSECENRAPIADEQCAGKIVYICDWLPPDFGAVGQYGAIATRSLAARGFDVTLAGLSSQCESTISKPAGRGRHTEVKLLAKPYDKERRLGRLLWTIKINSRLIICLWSRLRAADTILFTGSPPLFLHWIAPANLILRKKLIYRITDFHPECAMAERGKPSLLLGLLYRLTLFWRRRVDVFEVIGQDQGARLAEIGIPPARIVFRPYSSPVPIGNDTPGLPRPSGTAGKILLLYSGNWGVAHDHLTFIEGYRLHHAAGRSNVVLWLNATGSGARKVADALTALRLPFIRSEPVPIERLANLLVTPDAHLVTLSDAFVGYVLPSKVYGCIQSGKPVLFIGSARSDVHRICKESGNRSYRRIDVGDAVSLND